MTIADDLVANNNRLDAMREHLHALSAGDVADTAITGWLAYSTALHYLTSRLPASWMAEACAAGEEAARRYARPAVGGAA